MHLVSEIDVQCERKPVAPADRRITSPCSELEVRGARRCASRAGLAGELAHEDASCREAVPITLLVELLADHPVGSEQELDRMRNAEELMVLRDFLVEDSERAYDGRVGV